MTCQNCQAQIASAEICPHCGALNDISGERVPVSRESTDSVRCLYCTSMVSNGAKFCISCGREQSFRPQAKTSSSSTGKAIGWTCGGCAVVLVIAFLAILAVATAFFESFVGA